MKLRPYQERAVAFLEATPNAALFLDMGLGKTLITLRTLSAEKPTLIIAPLHVIKNTWQDEGKKWGFDFTFNVLHGARKRLSNANVHLINPEGLQWLTKQPGVSLEKFKVLILDESTMFKDGSTKRFKLLAKLLPHFERKVLLTGSPVANGLMGIFSQIKILDSGERFGKYITHFKSVYFDQSPYSHYVFKEKPNAKELIFDKIKDIAMTLSAKDYLSLPDIMYSEVEITLPAAIQRAYKSLEKTLVAQIGGKTLITQEVTCLLQKLRQMASGSVIIDGEPEILHREKVKAIRGIVDNLNGNPVIICYEYKADLVALKSEFGDLPNIKCDGIQDKWNRGDIPILPLSPNSSAHGLNLQNGGQNMIFMTLGFSREKHEQIIARLHRSGQSRPVLVQYIMAKTTVDYKVLKMLRDKELHQADFLNMFR